MPFKLASLAEIVIPNTSRSWLNKPTINFEQKLEIFILLFLNVLITANGSIHAYLPKGINFSKKKTFYLKKTTTLDSVA